MHEFRKEADPQAQAPEHTETTARAVTGHRPPELTTTGEDQAAERRSELPSSLYFHMRTHVHQMASAAGAPTIERPVWPGSLSTTTYAEPRAGLREAVSLQGSVERVIEDYARYARVEGVSWGEIGEALGLAADEAGRSVAEVAYEQIVGQPDLWRNVSMYWRCPACGQDITDRGPYNSRPADNEHGHAEDCSRVAAEVDAWQAEQDRREEAWQAERDREASG